MTVAVLLPFLGFGIFVSSEMGSRLSRDVVRYFLKSKASDLADKINLLLAERDRDLRIWVEDEEVLGLLASPGDPERRTALERRLDRYCREKQVYDLLFVAEENGRVLASNTRDRAGTFLPPAFREQGLRKSLREFPWFEAALRGEFARVDWHVSPLLHPELGGVSQRPSDYGVGFAGPVRDAQGRVRGVWYSLMNWSFLQTGILDRARSYFSELQSPESYQSGYAWLWKNDADLIIAHKSHSLYGKRLSEEPVSLPILRDTALRGRLGVFPEYEWPPGTPKNAAFCWTHTAEEGGFGWIVGIGIDNEDILASVTELRQVLGIATALILGGITLWIWIISHAITRPIKSLIRGTEEIAKGKLDARVRVETRDELGALAAAFNRMAEDLSSSRDRLIRAEKEAAWREMARQVAHEIKNPLTPMRLSTTLLEKAWADKSPEFPKIFAQTTQTMLRQIESLRRIAADFSAFAGPPSRKIEKISAKKAIEDCLPLYAGWSREKNIVIEVDGEDGEVLADAQEFRRLCINLLDNALQAVGSQGAVRVTLRREGGDLVIAFADSGPGISPEVQQRLFEPYFSTKTDGTGLGLAICRRIAHDLRGEISARQGNPQGAIFELRAPLAGSSSAVS